MLRLLKSYPFIIGIAVAVVTLFSGWGLPMILPSTPHNGIIISITGLVISAPFFIWALILYRRQENELNQSIFPQNRRGKVIIWVGIGLIVIGFGTVLSQLNFQGKTTSASPIPTSTPVAKTEEVISVAPKETSIQQPPYTTYGDFVVHNNQADKTQFDVWVLVTFVDCGIDFSHIGMDSPNFERETVSNLGSIPISSDFGLAGNNTKSQRVICLLIRKLLPSESRTFTLSVAPTANDFVGGNASIAFSIGGYSDKPGQVISKGGMVYQQFKPPIDMTVTTIYIYIPKSTS